MKKPKILFILHLPPPVHGAAMVGKWIKESNLIHTTFETDFINLSTSSDLQAIGKGRLQKIRTLLNLVRKVYRALRAKKYDLCYMTLTAQGPGFYKDMIIVSILKLFRKKIVYHFHNKGVQKHNDSIVHNKLYGFAFANTKSILLSPYLYPDIQRYVDKKDVYICPNGIADNLAQEKMPIIDNSTPNNILFLSNMMEEKGVYVLLDACKQLKKNTIPFRCHFIGAWSDITEKDFYQKLKALELTEHVFYHGKQYGDDKIRFFKEADIFVFPTYYHKECFPLVLLEAMQAGLPVISTNEGGIPSMVEEDVTGILVPQGEIIPLYDAIASLLKNPEQRKAMGSAGRQRYEQLFTFTKFETKLTNILSEIVEN